MIQLKDCTNSKVAISEMLTNELKFTADCLRKWFNAKLKLANLGLSNNAKRKYEITKLRNYEIKKIRKSY